MAKSIQEKYTPIEIGQERCEKIRKIYLTEINYLLDRERELDSLVTDPVQLEHVVKKHRRHAAQLAMEYAPNLFLLNQEIKELNEIADWLHRERKRIERAELHSTAKGKVIAENYPVDWAGKEKLGRAMELVLDRNLILTNREIQVCNAKNIDNYHELEAESRTDLQSVRDARLLDDIEKARQAHYNPPQKEKTHNKERTGAYRMVRLFYTLVRGEIFYSWNDVQRRAKDIQHVFYISPGSCGKAVDKVIEQEVGTQIDPCEYVRVASDISRRLRDAIPSPADDKYLELLFSRKQLRRGRVDEVSRKYYSDFIKVPLLNLAKRRLP
ncbi:MAG: hypothetical protein GY847_10295 [Proteobacteria bacterium]|nr:hypothetical protein [Pseudomonadota bacterium]